MRIVVLAGGLSMERNVSLSSGTRICRALRARGHQAALVDLFLGLEGYDGAPESIFDAPDGLCGDFSVAPEEPVALGLTTQGSSVSSAMASISSAVYFSARHFAVVT